MPVTHVCCALPSMCSDKRGGGVSNPISSELDRQDREPRAEPRGLISRMAQSYTLQSQRLVGLLLRLDYAESHIVTCDAWKRNCGGVPKGAFILFRVDPDAVAAADRLFCDRLVLARVTEAAPVPVESNVQQTLFQAHKLQAQLDPLTRQDLQWGALRASVVGTFYDTDDAVSFGNDIDTFFSPFSYVAYMPTPEDLGRLVNSFVRCMNPVEIGYLRYTETPAPFEHARVPVLIDPRDIVGEPNAAQRLANFGKTRYGKSNSNKIIARAIFQSGLDVAQVFFDPSGEYTFINDQDRTSLYAEFHERSVRYSLAVRDLRPDEARLGLPRQNLLRVNFYSFPSVGHALIVALWDTENTSLPGYFRPVLDWTPEDTPPNRAADRSAFNHYWRTMGMWYALLYRANFQPPHELLAPVNFAANVKDDLLRTVPGIRARTRDGNREFDENGQPITVLQAMYARVAALHREHAGEHGWFDPSDDGSPYFNDAEEKLLRMFSDNTIIAHNYIRPFNQYHSPEGASVFDDIATHVSEGRSVFIDMSSSNETVRNNLVDRICRRIFREQNRRFNSSDGVGRRFVMFYFEEAHRLFNKDDNDLNSIYNLLAKEGAKLNIAMVYSTQSMTTISPDLIKNTDNFLIAHLDDDREAREVARKYAFRDVAEDVQRIQSKGFVRMVTRSHRFALPVQVHLFQAQRDGEAR
jgi:hypothetical protein